MTLFGPEALHPAASQKLDRTGEELLNRFKVHESRTLFKEPFATRRELPVLIVSKSDPVSELVDFAERTIGWLIYSGGQEDALIGDDYLSLRRCVERLRRKPPFRDGFSNAFLEKAIVNWCAERKSGQAVAPLSSYLLDASAAAFTEHVYLAPLSNIEIESDFELGSARVVTLPPALFEATRAYARVLRPQDPNAGHSTERLAKELTYCVAVEVRVGGEPRFAREHALAVARDVAGVLRFFSPATVAVSVPSAVQLRGFAPLPWTMLLATSGNRIVRSEHQVLHAGLATWKMGSADISRLATMPLANLHHLFDGRTETLFAAHVRKPFFAYCRALGRFDTADRLVDTISALEALLLGGSDAPLMHVVGERLAFLTASQPAERMQVLADYRRAYAMRSGAVHHLRGIDDELAADRLLRHAFIAFYKAIEGLSIFTHPDELFAGINRIKFGGTSRSVQCKDPEGKRTVA